MKANILLIDDEEALRFTFERFLQNEGYEVSSAGNYNEAIKIFSGAAFDLVISDIILGEKTGIDVLQAVREKNACVPVIIITGQPTAETASEALRLGAFDYVFKPVSKKTLLHTADMALQHKALLDENNRYRSNLEAIFRSVKDAIITVDSGLRLIEANAAAENVCGFSRNSIGEKFPDIEKKCNGRCIDAARTCIGEKRDIEIYRLECLRRDRAGQTVRLAAVPLLNSGGVACGCVMTVKDETRLEELERELSARRQFHNIIGTGPKMQKIYALIESLADVESTVLVTGESGTGKELVAEALHYKGARSGKPFIKVNCSALSESLLESELFGHVKGAFTGSVKDKAGRFQLADGGTIFMDEIGDISPLVQLKLLRVLQEKVVERVGDSTPVKVNVRVVAATNKDLRREISLGNFREDLFYRLKVIEVCLPPLRERREDIPLLTGHFLKKFNGKLNREITGLSAEVEKLFMEYPWPGNIRELEHALEHACILCRQSTITIDDLPPELTEGCAINVDDPAAVLRVLEKTDWNISKAARQLGLTRSVLYRKIEEIKFRTGRNI